MFSLRLTFNEVSSLLYELLNALLNALLCVLLCTFSIMFPARVHLQLRRLTTPWRKKCGLLS